MAKPTETSTNLSFENTANAFFARSDAELQRMYLLFLMMNNNFLVNVGAAFLKWGFKLGFPLKYPVKYTIFEHFCGGETIEDCQRNIEKLAQYGIGTILDYSVEGEKTEKGFDETEAEILRTVHRSNAAEEIPFCVFKVTGVGRFDLLAKVQSDESLTTDEQQEWQGVQKRVNTICRTAFGNQVRVFIDGEETWIQETIDTLAYQMMEKYNQKEPIVYNTFQLYTRNCLDKLQYAIMEAKEKGYFLGVKLVRGAYMEKERERAEKMGYADPIQPNKESCDNDFDKALALCLENKDIIGLCAGTHNEKSSYLLAKLMEEQGVSPQDPNFYFAQLYGMSDHISYNLAEAGYNVAKYVPYGSIADVMPYLFRRAEENTSISGQSSREFLLIQKERNRRKHQNLLR